MQLVIKQFVHGGQALAHDADGHPYFIWNALPGETVEVVTIKKKKDFSEGIAENILQSSPHRIEPREEAYLSTSPWQIMDFAYENEMKLQIAQDTFQFQVGQSPFASPTYSDGIKYGYRNKMEFSFYADDNDAIHLAFFQRGHKRKVLVEDSLLASSAINTIAKQILRWINTHSIPGRSLKTLIIRSNQEGKAIAGLFLKDKLDFPDYPVLNDTLVGLQVYYSTHRSPASVPTELLKSFGQEYLEEKVLGTTLRYGLLSFFQVNIPVFEKALLDIKSHLSSATPVVDYYAGVGTISLALSDIISTCVQVEENEEAVHFATENIARNKSNFTALTSPVERMLEHITGDIQLIVDPPRAGLHQKVVEKILEEQPPKIIYLSCNPVTQARDVALLKDAYDMSFVQVYNFFPRTPHIETLVVLQKK